MAKRFLIAMFGVSFLLSACSSATGIKISKAWTRPALKAGNGAVYFLLQNHSAAGDELTGISSDAVQAAEMHESRMDGDVMQMRQVLSIPIQGKESILLEPGGYHIMLVGLKQELRAGDEIQLTLHFENHRDIRVTVPVQETALDDLMNGN